MLVCIIFLPAPLLSLSSEEYSRRRRTSDFYVFPPICGLNSLRREKGFELYFSSSQSTTFLQEAKIHFFTS